MPALAGTVIEYTYDGADAYLLEFGEGTAHWTALTGKHAGENRTEQADIVLVAPDVWFVCWLEPTQEVVSLSINLAERRIYASYYFDGDRFFWSGNITEITPPSAAH